MSNKPNFIENNLGAISGQVTVAVVGTAVQGPSVATEGEGFIVEALPANTGYIYVGNDGAGDVTSANGFPLDAGTSILLRVRNLNEVYFDASVAGEKAAWLKV